MNRDSPSAMDMACRSAALSARAWRAESARTARVTSPVADTSSRSRSARSIAPLLMARSRPILMLTSRSEQFTPAELSTKSVLQRPPCMVNSTRAASVRPRFPPSATTRARSSVALTRIPSRALSPTAPCSCVLALTQVPTPPFHSRSTGARSTARTRASAGSASSPTPSSSRTCSVSSICLADSANTPPPADSTDRS